MDCWSSFNDSPGNAFRAHYEVTVENVVLREDHTADLGDGSLPTNRRRSL